MVGPRVIYEDLTTWLTHWMHAELTAARADGHHQATNFRVSGTEWHPDRHGGPEPDWQVIIRDDGANQTSIVTSSATVGITVLGGTKDHMDQAKAIADLVYAIAGDCAGLQPRNPIAAVIGGTSPVPVLDPDASAARLYMTLEVALAGRALAR